MKSTEEALFDILALRVLEAIGKMSTTDRTIEVGQSLVGVLASRLLDAHKFQLDGASLELIIEWLEKNQFISKRGRCAIVREGRAATDITTYRERETAQQLRTTRLSSLRLDLEGMRGLDDYLDRLDLSARRAMQSFLRDELPRMTLPEAMRTLVQRMLEASADAQGAKEVADRAKQVPPLLGALMESVRMQESLLRALGTREG